MPLRIDVLALVLTALVLARGVAAQDVTTAPDSAHGPAPDTVAVVVLVETNFEEALVYADSVVLGPASHRSFVLPTGTREVRLVPPDLATWSVPPQTAAVEAAPGDTVTLSFSFPHRYRVESVPFGAVVHLETPGGWQKLGTTPLDHTSPEPLEGRFVVEYPGYVLTRIEPGRSVWNRHTVTLSPKAELDPEAARVAWKPPRRHREWIDYAAIGTALVAGAVAVHYKFKADRIYDTYLETTDPALRPEMKRYDTYSGVALGVMQAGIGLFAVRLALR